MSPHDDLGSAMVTARAAAWPRRPATGRNRSESVWLAIFHALGRYHRYQTAGLEHLLEGSSALIVGYHGRPLAWDLCMLTVELHRRTGAMPHGIVHRAFAAGPVGNVVRDLGFLTDDGDAIAAAIRRGEHILVAPGGTHEGCRPATARYQVDWANHLGYLRLAWRHDLPIVPVAAVGVDDGYLGINDGDPWGRRVRMPLRLPFWVGLGMGGPFPFAPPWPVTIRQRIGAPLRPWRGRAGEPSPDDLLAAHRVVQGRVQGLLDALRASHGD